MANYRVHVTIENKPGISDPEGKTILNDLVLKGTHQNVTRINTAKMLKHFCKTCNAEFDGPTQIQIEEQPNEEVANGLILIERGQYTCHKCNAIIGEYRVFSQPQ